MANYQTLDEFLREPFWDSSSKNSQKLSEYERRYAQNEQKIILNAHTVIEGSYYFHVKVPSESQKKKTGIDSYYDVVIRFFTTNPGNAASPSLVNYWIQFFSNSPGFIYKYAVLYKQEGYLIDFLYNKLDPRYFDKLPETTNKDMEISFDKSIYFACRFLKERKFQVLSKFTIPFGKRLMPTTFFKEIRDFQSVKLDGELRAFESKTIRSLQRTLGPTKPSRGASPSRTKTVSGHKVKIGPLLKKVATKSTSKTVRTVRKTAQKSTRKSNS